MIEIESLEVLVGSGGREQRSAERRLQMSRRMTGSPPVHSGTSGKPKACSLVPSSLLWFRPAHYLHRRPIGSPLDPEANDPTAPVGRLATFPMFHNSGMGSLLGPCTRHNDGLASRAFDSARVIELSEEEDIPCGEARQRTSSGLLRDLGYTLRRHSPTSKLESEGPHQHLFNRKWWSTNFPH